MIADRVTARRDDLPAAPSHRPDPHDGRPVAPQPVRPSPRPLGGLGVDLPHAVDVLVVGAGQAGLGAAYRRTGQVTVVRQRVVAAEGEVLGLADGTGLRVSSVLWCTGFRPDTRWLDVPGATGDDGAPVHAAGASPVRGLHWLGLPWQTRLNSSIIDGVDRDARAVARRVRTRATR